MKATTVCGILAVLSSAATAQPWTSEQQALVDAQAKCNDGWVDSHREYDFELFVAACPHVPGALAWYTNSPDRVDYWGNDEFWQGPRQGGVQFSWEFLEPIDIWIDGDIGAIYFPIAWTVETPDGTKFRNPSRRVTTFQRRNGEWLFASHSIAGFEESPESLLVNAAREGNLSAAAFLLDQGLNVNERDARGYTALHAAAYEGHLEVVELLTERGAMVDDQQNTERIAALHAAAETNRLAIAAYLLGSGADVNPVQAGGWTPIMRATFKGYAEMVKLLRNYGGQCADGAGESFYDYCLTAGS
jgi:hypothetical protein